MKSLALLFSFVASCTSFSVQRSSGPCVNHHSSGIRRTTRTHQLPIPSELVIRKHGHRSSLTLAAKKKPDGENGERGQSSARKSNNRSASSNKNNNNQAKTNADDKLSQPKTKEELMKAVGEEMKNRKKSAGRIPIRAKDEDEEEDDGNILDKLNPFKAGQKLRKTIDTALTSIAVPAETKSKYYLDDRFSEGGSIDTEQNPALVRLGQDDYSPEVLVVGATGEVGRLVVQRLRLDGRFRIRVLVRDLYTRTLNMLGTGVTYCQGDLGNMDSLEYALTDVDKIVFCAGAPRPDEDQFREKFQDFMSETLRNREASPSLNGVADDAKHDSKTVESDSEWEQLESVLALRARLAEQVDCVGMQNLVRAYQHVRHADYGTSQAAKRSLFKFQSRPEDFELFTITDDDEDDQVDESTDDAGADDASAISYLDERSDEEEDEEDDSDVFDDEYEDYSIASIERRKSQLFRIQCQWVRNQFGHGVFVGRIPKSIQGGEASIVSARLRSRDNPESGIELGTGFAGFICRVCSDGGVYEAFVRTGAYHDQGIEYVCQFSTSTKPVGRNKSRNKFATVRLPFSSFKPVKRDTAENGSKDASEAVNEFQGRDVRFIGFRFRSDQNKLKAELEKGEVLSFYLALSYIKLYRSQPEPEFIYLSDARIPPVVRNGMIRHESRLIKPDTEEDTNGSAVKLVDESVLKAANDGRMSRSHEEVYYKFRGEEILKNSGLSYSIIRIGGFNESPAGEASTIELKSTNEGVTPVSRAEVAQVCVTALLDPNALNKSFYMSKKPDVKTATSKDENIEAKFAGIPVDAVI